MFLHRCSYPSKGPQARPRECSIYYLWWYLDCQGVFWLKVSIVNFTFIIEYQLHFIFSNARFHTPSMRKDERRFWECLRMWVWHSLVTAHHLHFIMRRLPFTVSIFIYLFYSCPVGNNAYCKKRKMTRWIRCATICFSKTMASLFNIYNLKRTSIFFTSSIFVFINRTESN